MNLSEYVSTELRQLRAEKNLKLKEVAEYVDIDSSTISRYEQSKTKITLEELEKLLKYYDVSLKEFFERF